jgi:hypothetical protein
MGTAHSLLVASASAFRGKLQIAVGLLQFASTLWAEAHSSTLKRAPRCLLTLLTFAGFASSVSGLGSEARRIESEQGRSWPIYPAACGIAISDFIKEARQAARGKA